MSRVPILAPDVTVIVPEMELLPVLLVIDPPIAGTAPLAAIPLSRNESIVVVLPIRPIVSPVPAVAEVLYTLYPLAPYTELHAIVTEATVIPVIVLLVIAAHTGDDIPVSCGVGAVASITDTP